MLSAFCKWDSVGHAPVDHLVGGLAADGAGMAQLLLLKGHAAGGYPGLVLHPQLTLQIAAPHGLGKAALGLHEGLDLLQASGGKGVFLQIALGSGVQTVVDVVQRLGNGGLQPLQRDKLLDAVVPPDQNALTLLHVLGADLHPKGNALHLIFGEFPAGRLVGKVALRPIARAGQPGADALGGVDDAGLVLGDGNHHHLHRGDAGRHNQAAVVPVGHDNAADDAGGQAPGGLVGILGLIVLVGAGNVKGPGEAVAKVVAGAGLKGLAVVHHALDGIGGLGPGELLLVGLAAPDDGHGQHVFAEGSVNLQHAFGFLNGLLRRGVHGVALLPEELPVAQEGAGGLFPPEHRAPLVVELGQVPPGVDDFGVMLAEQGLGGGADAQALLQRLAAAEGDPGALGREALHVVLLLLQQRLGNQQGEIDVFVAGLFKPAVQPGLDILPQGVSIGAKDEKPLHAGIFNQLGLLAHVGVPFAEVLLHVGDLFNLLFIVLCHAAFRPFSIKSEHIVCATGGKVKCRIESRPPSHTEQRE
ncbi:hypothetical protein SDC9_87228 [bioreactor metagenome]|uniref:Uncharacterized protein n=1 Tax=bioreactor metagenome TaxID=1076179 RepID=A0A644ZSL1_9ZZZZ